MIEWSKKGGYQGSIISFYDYNNGKVYEPFQKQRNVLYGPPVYLKNSFWFLQGDYNSGKQNVMCDGLLGGTIADERWIVKDERQVVIN